MQRQCPTCAAPLQRSDYACAACGHVLEDVVAVKVELATGEEVRAQFGRFPTFATVSLPVEDALPEGTLVALRLILPKGWGEMMIPSRVTGMAHTPSTPSTPYRLQMNLLKVEADKQERIRSLVSGQSVPPPAPPQARPAPPSLATAAPPWFPPSTAGTAPERPAHTEAPPSRTPPSPAVIFDAEPPPEPAAARRMAAEVAEIDVDLEELLRPVASAVAPQLSPVATWVARLVPVAPPVRERAPEQVSKVLTDFVLGLTRAIVKTSYYEPDHQASAQSKVGLFDTFKLLLQDAPEVTFLNQSTDDRRAVLVSGIFEEPMELERVMVRAQAELFGQKFAGYLEARSLLSVSFKRSLDHGEFHRFIDLLATPAHLARGESQDLVHALAAQSVRGISVVFKEDLARRKLSWRVGLALTRLKKDLSLLPLYQGFSPEELRVIRYEVFRDVIRPLRQVHLLRELLFNCDLVAQEVVDLTQEDIELLVLEAVVPETLPELLQRFAQDAVDALREGDVHLTDLLRLARNLARKLASTQQDVKELLFRQLFEAGVIGVEDLPAALQEKLAIQKKADRFLQGWRHHLQVFDDVRAAAIYRKHLSLFLLVFPEILSRFELDVAVKIALVVARHRALGDGFPGRQAIAGEWLEAFGTSLAGAETAWQIAAADKVRREALLTLCGVLGNGGVPILFKALSDCPTRSIRLELVEALVSLREQTSRFLAAELEKKNIPWYYQRNLLSLMGRVGDESDLSLVGFFLSDRHPRVRLEALLSVCALDPGASEKMLVWALADADADIRGVAVRQLVQRHSTAPELFDHFRSVLWRIVEVDDAQIQQVCSLLATYQAGDGHDLAVDLLLEVLQEQDQPKGFWSILNKGQDSDTVKIAACQTLGRMRAQKAVRVLSKLSDSKSRILKQAATQALRYIQQSQRI